MISLTDARAQILGPWERQDLPLTTVLRNSHAESRCSGLLRHRRTIDLTDAQPSLISGRGFSIVPPPLSCSSYSDSDSSCSSEDSDWSERAISEARSLFGFPYPLLLLLVMSFVLLPMQLFWSAAGHHSFVQQRDLAASMDTRLDAVVFVALGPAATSPVLGWSVHSAVEVGGWNGAVYVITDNPDAVKLTLDPAPDTSSALKEENLNILKLEQGEVDMAHSLHIFNAKLTKCRLLHILPQELQNILYIDADIIVGSSLNQFMRSVSRIWKNEEKQQDMYDDDVSIHEPGSEHREGAGVVSLGLFEDGKSFTAGFCTDCDTWNTGVMSISRGKSDRCLDAWCEALALQGGTDQAALDDVISQGKECQNIQALDRQYVRMMKDFFVVMGMVGKKTFNHFTGILRPQNMAPVHRRFYERLLGKELNLDLIPGAASNSSATATVVVQAVG